MLNLKLITIILMLVSSFVTMAQDVSVITHDDFQQLKGKHYRARVIANRAIVYSDENMLSPLGYIATGKRVTVGNPRRINKELVPIVVSGRLAFIQIKDLRFDNEEDERTRTNAGSQREHDIDIVLEKPSESLSKNNSLYFSLHTFSAGDELKTVFNEASNEDPDMLIGFQLQAIHRKADSTIFWGLAMDYSGVSNNDVKFTYFFIQPTMGLSILRNPVFLIDLYASLDLGVSTAIDIVNNTENEPGGFAWGPQLTARAVLFPNRKYHLTGAMSLRNYSINGLKDIKGANNQILSPIKKHSALSLSLGVGMEFK